MSCLLYTSIARRHGLHLDQEPSYGGRDYLEKQDYILMKQKEQLAAQEQTLEELTLKIEDVETLLDDVSDAAYDKAVEVVTDTVRQETHKEDIRLIEETKKWVLSPAVSYTHLRRKFGWAASSQRSRLLILPLLKSSKMCIRDRQMVEEPQPYTYLKVLFLFTPSPCWAR